LSARTPTWAVAEYHALPECVESDESATGRLAAGVSESLGGITLKCQPTVLADDSHTLRRTKATLMYRRIKDLRVVPLLLGHTKLESSVRQVQSDLYPPGQQLDIPMSEA
jgi:hypothetical protein